MAIDDRQERWNALGPEGQLAWFESNPDQIPANQAVYDRLRLNLSVRSGERMPIRSAMQGLTIGWADEIEARAKSLLSQIGSNEISYEEARDDIRNRLERYRQEYPTEAFTTEILGSFIPTALMLLTGYGAPSAGANLFRMAGVGAIGGGVGGYGYSEQETIGEALPEIGLGGALGGALAPTLGFGGKLLGGLLEHVTSRFGRAGNTAVNREIDRLVNMTGKSREQIVADLMNGSLMAENATLSSAIKSYQASGTAGRELLELTKGRRIETARLAQQDIARGLTGQRDPNVLSIINTNRTQLRKIESDAYTNAQGVIPLVEQEIIDNMQDIMTRNPDIISRLEKTYRADKVLNKTGKFWNELDDGSIEITRTPTIQDAEEMRKALDRLATASYREGDGVFYDIYKGDRDLLRRQLDDLFPDLRSARNISARNFQVKDAYDFGQTILNPSVTEDAVINTMRELADNPQALDALRVGLMGAIKKRQPQTILRKLNDPLDNEYNKFALLFPEDDIDDLLASISRSRDAQELYSIIRSKNITEPLRRETARLNRPPSDAQGIALQVINWMRGNKPELTDSQRRQVINILFQEDPAQLQRMITNRGMASVVEGLIQRSGQASRTAIPLAVGSVSGDIASGLQL